MSLLSAANIVYFLFVSQCLWCFWGMVQKRSYSFDRKSLESIEHLYLFMPKEGLMKKRSISGFAWDEFK